MGAAVLVDHFDCTIRGLTKLAGGGAWCHRLMLDVPRHALHQVSDAGVQFRHIAFEYHFDATIGQVADESSGFVFAGDLPRRIAKADALDAARKIQRVPNDAW